MQVEVLRQAGALQTHDGVQGQTELLTVHDSLPVACSTLPSAASHVRVLGQPCGDCASGQTRLVHSVCSKCLHSRAFRMTMWWNVNSFWHGQPSAEIAQVDLQIYGRMRLLRFCPSGLAVNGEILP